MCVCAYAYVRANIDVPPAALLELNLFLRPSPSQTSILSALKGCIGDDRFDKLDKKGGGGSAACVVGGPSRPQGGMGSQTTEGEGFDVGVLIAGKEEEDEGEGGEERKAEEEELEEDAGDASCREDVELMTDNNGNPVIGNGDYRDVGASPLPGNGREAIFEGNEGGTGRSASRSVSSRGKRQLTIIDFKLLSSLCLHPCVFAAKLLEHGSGLRKEMRERLLSVQPSYYLPDTPMKGKGIRGKRNNGDTYHFIDANNGNNSDAGVCRENRVTAGNQAGVHIGMRRGKHSWQRIQQDKGVEVSPKLQVLVEIVRAAVEMREKVLVFAEEHVHMALAVRALCHSL